VKAFTAELAELAQKSGKLFGGFSGLDVCLS
jgi:hypothetical protein